MAHDSDFNPNELGLMPIWVRAVVVVSVILTAALLAHMAAFYAVCTKSAWVSRIEDSTATVENLNCQQPLPMPWDEQNWPKSTERNHRWNIWLRELEPLVPWVKPESISVVIDTARSEQVFFGGGYVFMARSAAERREPFQRHVLLAALARTYPSLAEDRLALETFADFSLALATGVEELTLIDGSALAAEDITWSRLAQNFWGYCQSAWRDPQHAPACRSAKPGKSLGHDEVHYWSLRPLLVRGLLVHLRKLSWSERAQWLSQIFGQAQNGRWLQPWPYRSDALSWLKDSLQGLGVRGSSLRQVADQLELPSDEPVPFAVAGDGPWLDSLMRSQARPVRYQVNQRRVWLSKWGEVVDSSRGATDTLAWISCRSPQLSQWQPFRAKSVIWIRACDPASVNWTPLWQGQVDKFFAENRRLAFLWVDLSALRLAEKIRQPPLTTQDKPLRLSFLRELSHWQSDVFEPGSEIYRPRAAISVIRSHRADRSML